MFNDVLFALFKLNVLSKTRASRSLVVSRAIRDESRRVGGGGGGADDPPPTFVA